MMKLTPRQEKTLRGILSNYMVPKKCRDSLEKILREYLDLKEEVVFRPSVFSKLNLNDPDIMWTPLDPPPNPHV